MMMMRRDEHAIGIAAGIVLKTGEQLLGIAEEVMKEGSSEQRKRKLLHLNMERWNTIASQTQEATHAFVTSKGECRW